MDKLEKVVVEQEEPLSEHPMANDYYPWNQVASFLPGPIHEGEHHSMEEGPNAWNSAGGFLLPIPCREQPVRRNYPVFVNWILNAYERVLRLVR